MAYLPKKMKAAVVKEFGKPLVIEELPVPEPQSSQVLVKVEAAGVCHTDLHAAEGDWPVKPTLPLIPGHEGVGIVVAAGSAVAVIKEGDRVGVPWLHTTCGRCEYCISGRETLCFRQQMTGYTVSGSYGEYLLADPKYVGLIPAKLNSLEVAPILCAGVTVYKGLKETDAKPGDWVAISGIGGLGHMAVQYAKAMGMNVIAVDVVDSKLELAHKLGADLSINSSKQDPIAIVQKEIGGVHGSLVTAVSRSAFAQALGMLRRGGTMALVGLPPGDFPLPIFDMVLNRKTVRGSIVGTRLDLMESLEFAAAGKVKATIEVARLEDINKVFERMRKGAIDGRIVMKMAG